MDISIVPHEVFWQLLTENNGLFALTAQAIRKNFSIPCTSRQVKARAELSPDLLTEIKEDLLDEAESKLLNLMKAKNETISLEATRFFIASQKFGKTLSKSIVFNF